MITTSEGCLWLIGRLAVSAPAKEPDSSSGWTRGRPDLDEVARVTCSWRVTARLLGHDVDQDDDQLRHADWI